MTQFRREYIQLQRGFTLLELLISITLLGFILVLLFGGLRLGVRSWDAVQQRVDNLNSVRSVESFLRREMEKAYPYRWKGALGQRLAFLGERNKVNFVTQLPGRIGAGGVYAASLELEQNSRGRRLIWKHLPVTSQTKDFSSLEQVPEMVLAGTELHTVDDIWLSYFGTVTDNTAPVWTDRWDSPTRMPLLIRIQVRFADGTEWPDFVVAPRLSSELPR